MDAGSDTYATALDVIVALIAGPLVSPSSDADDDGGQTEAKDWETHGDSDEEVVMEM